MNKYLYGLDLSMECTGVTVFDFESLKPVLIMNISTSHFKKSVSHGLKLKYIEDEFIKLIETYPPSLIILERTFNRFPTATAVLYKVHGVINKIFHEYEQIYYSPKTVKECIINGSASKELVQKKILEKYPEIIFNNDDESDSFAVALTYLIKNNLLAWEKSTLYKKPIKRSKNIKDKQ